MHPPGDHEYGKLSMVHGVQGNAQVFSQYKSSPVDSWRAACIARNITDFHFRIKALTGLHSFLSIAMYQRFVVTVSRAWIHLIIPHAPKRARKTPQ